MKKKLQLLGIDFKIGLDQEDFSNCADMIMMEREGPQSFPLERIKYIPSFLLPCVLLVLATAPQSPACSSGVWLQRYVIQI